MVDLLYEAFHSRIVFDLQNEIVCVDEPVRLLWPEAFHVLDQGRVLIVDLVDRVDIGLHYVAAASLDDSTWGKTDFLAGCSVAFEVVTQLLVRDRFVLASPTALSFK